MNWVDEFPVRVSGGVEWVASKLLEKNSAGLGHGFLARRGGASEGPFRSLNLGYGRGDSGENVVENRKRAVKELGLPMEPLTLKQVHGDRVVTVRGGDPALLVSSPPEADAYITDVRGVPLMILTADCIPVVVYDPRTPALGVIHAGWRGTVLSIVWKSVIAMMDEFGTMPEDCLAVVGPGISQKCYEVGEDVRDAFDHSFSYSGDLFSPARDRYWNADLKEANRRQLLDALIRPASVEVCPYCTHCGDSHFFSARRDGIDSGRQGAVAWLE